MNFHVEVEMGEREVEKSSIEPLHGHHENPSAIVISGSADHVNL